MRINGWIGGGAASCIVGASFPVSEALVDYPYAAGQCVRYLAGALTLFRSRLSPHGAVYEPLLRVPLA